MGAKRPLDRVFAVVYPQQTLTHIFFLFCPVYLFGEKPLFIRDKGPDRSRCMMKWDCCGFCCAESVIVWLSFKGFERAEVF